MTEHMPPCSGACPVNTDVRGYLAAIARQDYAAASRLISASNPFPSVCAWVCPHPCEDNCRRGQVDSALSIRGLKRFAIEAAGVIDSPCDAPAKKTGKKVAVVGAGPGGLTAAYDLARQGHSVVVYEKNSGLGGHFLTSLPTYRLPREMLKRDTDRILAAGVEARTGVEVGKDITIARLREEYDALIISVGLARSKSLPLPGADHPGVLMALPFLHRANTGESQATGERVLVIGGGDVAMDVARTAVRLGAAQVNTICLELREQMPAHAWEIEEALDEGVILINGYGPVEILTKDGKIVGVKAQKVKSVFDPGGKFNPTFEPGEFLSVPCDTVIQAVGQVPDNSFLNQSGLAVDPRGSVQTDKNTLTTSLPGVFTCGEVVTGPGPAIAAVASGHRAAQLVNSFLNGAPAAGPKETEVIGPLPGKVRELIPKQKRQAMPVLAPGSRKNNFEPFELGFDQKAALCEALRCLSCGLGARVESEKCAACLTCLRVCPYQAPVVGGPAAMPPEGCQACGVCAAFCPAGAISVANLNLSAIEDTLRAVTEETRLVLFTEQAACRELLAAAGPQMIPALKDAAVITLPAAGALRLEWILSAFENGAARVVVAQGQKDSRHHAGSGKYLKGVIARAKNLLEAAGIPGDRLSLRKLDEGWPVS
ncbi:FAD-dependent oxidoreductase [Pelotomaculum propionicicum]|uniref:NADPH-Fe(3+) oxidoreductase subunit beta n=1 Tax=Pelotomaculum propionicicum TaxID=258475 RepID=A0A4Y7RVZ9_9FIRM|nr:FAD-dependent oxidoreductase [Pelotomaculum propionicicum]NLI12346.1 FAD-dependent oxidoreductase [Peptococcaceae bacterium]TEB13033.1 NADPH-Fe(3+) oxidoreductase subunit beta [Pelotomaculum propionicicum]